LSKYLEALNESRRKTRRRNRLVLIIVVCLMLALVMAYMIPMIINPMRRPGYIPLNYVLRVTPLGTHMDDVINIVENHRDWRIGRIDRERGFIHPLPHTVRPLSEGWPVIIGEKSIRVESLYTFIIVRVGVSIFYAFDADGYLIEVYMRRSFK